MENQSMRRRQTVLGEQLQVPPGGMPTLAIPPLRANGNASNSSLSQGSSLAAPIGLGGPRAASNTSLNSTNSASLTVNYPNQSGLGGSTSSNGGHGPASRSGHMRSVSRMSARMTHVDENSLTLGDQSSVRSAKFDEDEFDAQLLGGPVDPVMFLSRNLAGASAEDVLRFGEMLKQQAQRAADLEHRSLQHNQKSLALIASNVAKLAPAVAELRRKIGDLSLVSDAIRQDALAAQTGAALASSRRLSMPQSNRRSSSHANGVGKGDDDTGSSDDDDENLDAADLLQSDKRQSMFVLNSAWAQDLNELYKRVDGARRVLPPAPGRHLVLEEQGWMEMNLVTQQPVKPVLLVLLSDFFLLAAQHHGRFTHEWHTGLDEQLEISIDESKKVLRISQLGLLAPSLARLRAVYAEVCKLNELASTTSAFNRGIPNRSIARGSSKRSQRRSRQAISHNRSHSRSHSRSNSGFASGMSSSARNHARQMSHHSISSVPEITLEQKREGARILADIDAAIAERRYDEAVVQCLEYEDDVLVNSMVQDRAQHLSRLLLDQVQQFSCATRSELVANIRLLIKLGREAEAKSTLLEGAASDIEDQARQVHFMGDVSSYISQMAAIYFQTINGTVTIYREVFPKKEDSSFVVAWTKTQVDMYAAIFNRQLFRIAPEFQAYQRCREVSRLESSQLREQKMDMDFMLRYVWES